MVNPVAENFGEALLGMAFASIFFGVTLSQTLSYYNFYPKDTWKLKSLVAALLVLDTAHLGLVIHVMWYYFVDQFLTPKGLAFVVWSLLVQIIVSTIIASMVQGYYAWRISILTRSWLLPVFVIGFAVGHLVFDIYFVIHLWNREFSDIPSLTWATSASLGNSVASDLLVATTMTWYLQRSRTGYAGTDTLINRLIGYTVTTGLLTTIVSLTTLILFAVSPSFLSQLFYFSLAKFYTNSLLASLNSRESLRSIPSSGVSMSRSTHVHLDELRFGRSTSNHPGQVQSTLDVPVDEGQERLSDVKQNIHAV